MSFIRLKAPVKRAEEKGMSEVMISQRRPLSRQTVTAEEMVSRVERALLTEVRLTPKPGLVDIRNAGAHRDMDLASFEASTAAVAPWMEKFFIMGHDTANITPEQVLTMLRPVGMACETDMLEATGGVNTHRGAIFAFGLLSAAAGRLVARGEPVEQHRVCDQVARFCRGLVGASSPCLKERSVKAKGISCATALRRPRRSGKRLSHRAHPGDAGLQSRYGGDRRYQSGVTADSAAPDGLE
jgi:hypothetical protein